MKRLYVLSLIFILSISVFAAEATTENAATDTPTQSASEMYNRLITFIAENVTEKIKVALEENGLTIPFPQRDIHMINTPSD